MAWQSPGGSGFTVNSSPSMSMVDSYKTAPGQFPELKFWFGALGAINGLFQLCSEQPG
jgi:hypothetical protein